LAIPIILDETSLAATLWNLEEARLACAPADHPNVKAALDWVAGRQGKPGAYAGVLFAPTPDDLTARIGTPTGEDGSLGRGGAMHMLGEEAARALALWNRWDGWERNQVFSAIRRFGANDVPGRFCCLRCSVARWRALAAGQPEGWEDALYAGLRLLREDAGPGGGRWRRFPFYYTLLALADMPMEEAAAERSRVYPAAERALSRLSGDDRTTRFRRRAVEWVMDARG
jgi:hypothetical protein